MMVILQIDPRYIAHQNVQDGPEIRLCSFIVMYRLCVESLKEMQLRNIRKCEKRAAFFSYFQRSRRSFESWRGVAFYLGELLSHRLLSRYVQERNLEKEAASNDQVLSRPLSLVQFTCAAASIWVRSRSITTFHENEQQQQHAAASSLLWLSIPR